MFTYLSKKWIANHTAYNDPKVRQKYGVLCSVISILFNVLLAVFKLIVGAITKSIAIQADGLNNLSDVGSNLASLFGFKLANKHPDADHPYGHGRMEYLAGLFISLLIILVGLQTLKESVIKIITPEEVLFSIPACVVLIVSIIVKLWMCTFNKKIGSKINSSTLLAASQDSINDVWTTSATLASLLLTLVTDIPVDGVIGGLVSILVLKSGYEVCRSTVDPLLGKAPDKQLVKDIQEYVMSFDIALGIHDLIIHDYGPGRRFMTLHVEVDAKGNIMYVHDTVDLIERELLKKFHILTTIHMDPIDTDDEVTNELSKMVEELVKRINKDYSIHDFRVVSGPTHTNLIFDVLIPAGDEIPHKELKKQIQDLINEGDQEYYTVIQIDHSYV